MPRVIVEVEDDEARQRFYDSIVVKSRMDGEKNLHALSMNASKPSVWIFLPEFRQWYNLSRSFSKGEDSYVHSNLSFYTYNVDDVAHITHYNVHTRESELQCYPNIDPKYSKEVYRHLAAMDMSIPSPNYVNVYATSINANYPAEYDFRIVHPHGLTYFKFNEPEKAEPAVKVYAGLFDPVPLSTIVMQNAQDKKPVSETIEQVVSRLTEGIKGYATIKYVPLRVDFIESADKAINSKPSLN